MGILRAIRLVCGVALAALAVAVLAGCDIGVNAASPIAVQITEDRVLVASCSEQEIVVRRVVADPASGERRTDSVVEADLAPEIRLRKGGMLDLSSLDFDKPFTNAGDPGTSLWIALYSHMDDGWMADAPC